MWRGAKGATFTKEGACYPATWPPFTPRRSGRGASWRSPGGLPRAHGQGPHPPTGYLPRAWPSSRVDSREVYDRSESKTDKGCTCMHKTSHNFHPHSRALRPDQCAPPKFVTPPRASGRADHIPTSLSHSDIARLAVQAAKKVMRQRTAPLSNMPVRRGGRPPRAPHNSHALPQTNAVIHHGVTSPRPLKNRARRRAQDPAVQARAAQHQTAASAAPSFSHTASRDRLDFGPRRADLRGGVSRTTTRGPGEERNDPPITPASLPLPELTPSDNGLALTGRYIGYSVPPATSQNDPSYPPEVLLWSIGPDYRGGPSLRPTRYLRMDHPHPQEPPDLALGASCRPPYQPGTYVKNPPASRSAPGVPPTTPGDAPWTPSRNPPLASARDDPPEPTYRSGGCGCHSYCPSRPPPPSPRHHQVPFSRR